MQEEPDSLDVYRANHGLEHREASHWTCRIGPWDLCLPNFAWRQAAIDAHDRHHILTGYPLTLRGEIQMAAWEWGAGRYPDWRATAFCSPLILLGVIVMPRQTWRAFRWGRKCQSLYPSHIA